MRVCEIIKDGSDSAGTKILTVYAKLEPHYAVYRTDERVMVHFADDFEEDHQQRVSLALINPVRGQINGLIDGWRNSSAEQQAKAKIFDRRIADGLVVALQGDVPSADQILKAAKEDILAERTSWARFKYLLWASGAALAQIVMFSILPYLPIVPSTDALDLFRAAGAGTIGAFFSIAIGIRSRTILPDLQSRDNAADAVLRVVIGAIAAAVLVALLKAKFATLTVGTQNVIGTTNGEWLPILVVGFIAGFLERLVPDMLDKTVLAGTATSTSTTSSRAVTVTNVVAPTQPTIPAAPTGPLPNGEDRVDACDAAIAITPGEATADVELPAATGGVEETQPR